MEEQQLVNQTRMIMVNEWLTKVELEEIMRQIELEGMKESSEDREEHGESNQGEETVVTGGQQFDNQSEVELNTQEESMQDGTQCASENNDKNDPKRNDLCHEESVIYDRIMELIREKSKPPNKNFKRINKRTIKERIWKIEKIIDHVVMNNICETKQLMVAITWYTAENLDLRERKARQIKEPW